MSINLSSSRTTPSPLPGKCGKLRGVIGREKAPVEHIMRRLFLYLLILALTETADCRGRRLQAANRPQKAEWTQIAVLTASIACSSLHAATLLDPPLH